MTPELITSSNYLGPRLTDAESLITEAANTCQCVPFIASGKKIRAKLALLGASIYGEEPCNSVAIAAACEIIHLASLVHDDIVDASHIRRGIPTINRLLGSKRAVLIGDMLLSQALKLMTSFGTAEMLAIITDTAVKMSSGQIAEMDCAEQQDFSEEKYMEIITGKTASLMEASCRLGAICANAKPSHLEMLSVYGRNFGIAYQIYDDYLDIWGDENIMGKPAFADILAHKYTLPIFIAQNDKQTRQIIQDISDIQKDIIKLAPDGNSGLPSPLKEKLEELRGKLSQQNIPQKIADKASGYINKAKLAITELPHSQAKLDLLALPENTISFDL
ncbi:MAG: polyprenyl synthetase family protein [bacterium]|nr:polyprenyl synthetase family protein [bacterium]